MRPAVCWLTHELIFSAALGEPKSTGRAPAPYCAASVRRKSAPILSCSSVNRALPTQTTGGRGGASSLGLLPDGFGGTSAVTTARVIALNASSRPDDGYPNTLSSWLAVLPRAPTRAIANAVAMLTGEATQFFNAFALAWHSAYAKAVMPSVTAPTGASAGAGSRLTPSAISSSGALTAGAPPLPHPATCE